jgi:hypothetical protein
MKKRCGILKSVAQLEIDVTVFVLTIYSQDR